MSDGEMRYRVRNEDGELQFGSLYDISRAYAHGLVGPDDEVLEIGKEKWRKASTIPALATSAPPSASAANPYVWGVARAVVLAVTALVLMFLDYWLAGIALALVASVLVTRLTRRTGKR